MNDATFSQTYKNFGSVGDVKSWLYDWKGVNEWIFLKVNSFHTPWYDQVMTVLSAMGKHENLPYYIAFALLYMVMTLVVRKIRGHAGTKQYLTQWFGAMLVLVVSFVVVELTVHVIKDYFSYPRPYVALGTDNVTVVEHRPSSDDNHSFPSGHAAFITTMIVALWPVLSKNMRVFGGWLIFAVIWSRLALGVHFPADLLTGYLVAFWLVIFVRTFIYWLLRQLFRLNCG